MTTDGTGIKGALNIKLTGPDGKVKVDKTIKNLITTVGDEYYAKMAAAGVGGNSAPAALADGMKLGSGTTPVAKASTGSALATYISGSNVGFTQVDVAAVGTNVGYKITYVSEFGQGVGTGTIQEAVVCTDAETDDGGASADVIARVLTGSIVKGSADTLTLTWVHTFYDAA